MAETVVGLVIDKLIPLLKGVDKEVDAIKSELQSILAFLRDAGRRADTEGDSMAFNIEHVTDEYTLHITQWSQETQQRSLRL
ncbi:hypothetical protein PanWU01x14_356660 [Parasponia andersonii]|uniref:Disease resistance N-terminal domain-containing protein n=1 Tax=Parasponia andersonii TaxID=3476 RepID=A0A2P5A8V7_PARAD|nr:hypothetical protein PanWU01x14_356660 [Parasponia andersonii]